MLSVCIHTHGDAVLSERGEKFYFFTLVSPPETDKKSSLRSRAIEEKEEEQDEEEETRSLEHFTPPWEGWWRG